MDIDVIRAARREMEKKIHIAVADAMAEFCERTDGFSPYRIVIDLADATVLSDREKRYSVSKVLATIDL